MRMEIQEFLAEKIKKAVKGTYSIDLKEVFLEHPQDETFGDYATNVAMVISKQIGKPPVEIASNLCYKISSDMTRVEESPIIKEIYPTKQGFINVRLSDLWLKDVLKIIEKDSDNYGSQKRGKKETILVEFSQPNPNKPMHIGHARNNFLGSSLSNIFKFLGFDVIRVNYINNWGTHICKAMLMYKKHGNNSEPDVKSDHFVGKFYTRYEKEEAKNPEVKNELAEMFQKLEKGDPETVVLWKKIVDWVYKGWEKTYQDENVSFDVWQYQSNYKDSSREIVDVALEKGIAEKDETGAVIARLERYGIPDKVLLRSDGTSVYATQEIQLAKDSFEKYNLSKRLYVVDYRQSDYFKQTFKILEVLGFDWADKLFHVAYGTVDLPGGKMSSRRTGSFIDADEVFEKLVEAEKSETSDVDVARKVALAAFRYGMLKIDPKQDIIFRYDQVTKFEGNTGPYILYTYARANSILKKAESGGKLTDYEPNKKELDVLRALYKFPEVVFDASEKFSPNVIANYVFDVCQRFNSFYSEIPVLNAETPNAKEFRLFLIRSTLQVIKNSLSLLGIEAVEHM